MLDLLRGAVAQLGEHLLCKQGVSGSIPLSSTKRIGVEALRFLSFVRKKGLHLGDMPCACSVYIVKRRYVWMVIPRGDRA